MQNVNCARFEDRAKRNKKKQKKSSTHVCPTCSKPFTSSNGLKYVAGVVAIVEYIPRASCWVRRWSAVCCCRYHIKNVACDARASTKRRRKATPAPTAAPTPTVAPPSVDVLPTVRPLEGGWTRHSLTAGPVQPVQAVTATTFGA